MTFTFRGVFITFLVGVFLIGVPIGGVGYKVIFEHAKDIQFALMKQENANLKNQVEQLTSQVKALQGKDVVTSSGSVTHSGSLVTDYNPKPTIPDGKGGQVTDPTAPDIVANLGKTSLNMKITTPMGQVLTPKIAASSDEKYVFDKNNLTFTWKDSVDWNVVLPVERRKEVVSVWVYGSSDLKAGQVQAQSGKFGAAVQLEQNRDTKYFLGYKIYGKELRLLQ